MENKKDGTGTCYKRVSKKGTTYYNGKFTLDGKDYWLKLFQTKTQDNQPAVSFVIDPREPMQQDSANNAHNVTSAMYQQAKDGDWPPKASELPDSYFDDPVPDFS